MDKQKEIESKPLTIEELKALEVGDWVWVESEHDPYWNKFYAKKVPLSDAMKNERLALCTQGCGYSFRYSDYGTKWIAYKNKEQAENAGYGNVRQAVEEFAESLKEKFFDSKWQQYSARSVWCKIDELIKENFGK